MSNNNINKLDSLAYTIYQEDIHNGGAIADYTCALQKRLFKKFVYGSKESTEDMAQVIFNSACENMFIQGFKKALEIRKLLD